MEGISPESPRRAQSARAAYVVLIVSLGFGIGCRRHRGTPQAAPARASRGFDRSLSAPPQPLTDAEREKLRREHGAAPQPHFAARRVPPAHAVDLYVDESLRRTLQTAELGHPQALKSLLPAVPVRSVLAHGASGEIWIRGSELASYELKVNRRGEVKLQDRSIGGAHAGGHKNPDTPSVQKSVRREHEVSGLQWIEVRTPPSARLRDEP